MKLFRRRTLVIALVILALGAGVAWWQRAPLLAWHYVRQLVAADEAERDMWAQRIAELDGAAVPRLLGHLSEGNERACANVEVALAALVDRWGADDERAVALVSEVRGSFNEWSVPGRRAALRVPLELLRGGTGTPAPTLSLAAGHILGDAAGSQEPDLAPGALALAAALVERVHPGQWHDTCRELAVRYLRDVDARLRLLAVNLAIKIAKRSDPTVLEGVVPLLRDREAEVRRAAMLAVSSARQLVPDDDLLPWLHDSDSEVRRLCELALRSRGLQENHITLGKLISADSPAARLKVIEQLKLAPELEPGVWLRRMTEDPHGAVRAAAIRAAGREFHVDLRDRIRQMAQSDPSETVRNIARAQIELSTRNPRGRE